MTESALNEHKLELHRLVLAAIDRYVQTDSQTTTIDYEAVYCWQVLVLPHKRDLRSITSMTHSVSPPLGGDDDKTISDLYCCS